MVKKEEKGTKKQGHLLWIILKRVFFSILIIAGLDFITGSVLIPENFSSFRTKHYYYHHGLLPNQDTRGQWGSLIYPVKTNSLGFIDSVAEKIPLKSDNYRLLILGDSHSEGVGVPYLKTFSGILARDLKPSGIEVLNASCISYSPKIEYLKARYLIDKVGLKVNHIFVLIDISDLQNELVYDKFNPDLNIHFLPDFMMHVERFLRARSFIYYMVSTINEHRQQDEFMKTAKLFDTQGKQEGENDTYRLYAGFFDHFNDKTLLSDPQFHGVGEWYYNDHFKPLADKGIDMGEHYLLLLKKLCDEKGIGLTISVHPWHPQVLIGNPDDYYVTRWKTFAMKNAISFVNLFNVFIDGENPVLVNEMYYIKNDNHWNEFGHKKVAEFLEPYFLNEYHHETKK